MLRNLTIASLALSAALAAWPSAAWAAPAPAAPYVAAKEAELIAILQGDAAPAEKAITCKRLAICGSKTAVPALAALLPNAELSSWARIALEAIPDPSADAALRDALGKVQGRLLVGVINSIGFRRDAAATGALVALLKDADAQAASAAAVALGRIGSADAAKALQPLLASAPPAVRSAAAEGCILCAERALADGRALDAVALYDAVRAADVPQQRVLEATRGAILARGAAGAPLLVEQLRSTDKARFGLGLRVARELPGPEATAAVVDELGRAASDRQSLLLLALADRGDPKALPAVLAAVSKGADHVRMAAMSALERFADASCVPVLVEATLDKDEALALAAKAALIRLPGAGVDADLAARIMKEEGAKRRVLIEVAGQRRVAAALPAMVQCVTDADAGVRAAAVEALGILGGEQQVADLVAAVQKTDDPQAQAGMEKALMAVAGRAGAACTPRLLPLVRGDAPARRIVGLHALVCAGGTDALAAVLAAASDADETVQDEAVRTLSGWPSRWPDDLAAAEPLLALARSAKKGPHRVLALRGYLQCVQTAGDLKDDDRVARVQAALPLAVRPEDKKLVLGALAALPSAGAMAIVETLLADEAVRTEAELAMLKIASGIAGTSPERARAAAERLRKDASAAEVRDAAAKVLAQLDALGDYVTAWQVSGPYTEGDPFNTAYAPEKDAARAKWKPLPPGGAKQAWMMDLSAAVGGDRRAVYVRTYVHADADKPVRLEFGVDDGSRVWVNGKQVHADGAGGAAVPGEHKVAVSLKKGWNTLMLKITQDTGPWEFCLSLRAPDGGPPAGLKVQAQPPAE